MENNESKDTAQCECCDNKKKKTSKPKKRFRILRWIVRIFLLLILLLVATVGIVLWQLDRIVTTGIRVVGSELVGTKVDVTNVSIKPFEAAVQINGFSVGNPEGFQNPEAIRVENFKVDVDINTITSDKLVIDYLELSGVAIDLEYSFSKGLNLNILKDNVKKATGGDKPQEAPKAETAQTEAPKAEAQQPQAEQPKQAEAAPEEAPAEKKVVIRKLVLKDIKFTFSSKTLNISAPLPMPDIVMENVGEGKNLAETVEEVLDELLKSVLSVLKDSKYSDSIKNLGKDLANQMDNVVDAGEKVLNDVIEGTDGEVRKVLEDGSKILSDNKEEIKGALDGLFNRKKRKDK